MWFQQRPFPLPNFCFWPTNSDFVLIEGGGGFICKIKVRLRSTRYNKKLTQKACHKTSASVDLGGGGPRPIFNNFTMGIWPSHPHGNDILVAETRSSYTHSNKCHDNKINFNLGIDTKLLNCFLPLVQCSLSGLHGTHHRHLVCWWFFQGWGS